MPRFTSEDLENLKSALVSGASSVMIGNRNIMYRSKEELLELIRMVEDDLSGATESDSIEITDTIVGGYSRKGRCE